MGISAKVLADSTHGETRLITLEVEFHRFILSENNTHKAQSRNIQSSRAIPILRQLEQISNDPAMPVEWRKNKSGMVAGEEMSEEEVEKAKKIILWMRDCCVMGVKELHEIGLAKQWANRYVEPWMWTKGVVTATYEDWQEMFKLRVHYAAQPEIRVLFEQIRDAIEDSITQTLKEGEMHLPYVEHGEFPMSAYLSKVDRMNDMIKVSASCVAQVSYRRLDNSSEKADVVYEMLNLPEDGMYPEDPPHFSPTEHIAMAKDSDGSLSGNFHSKDFVQYRKLLEKGVEKDYIEMGVVQ